jgi:hypothetical protein
MDNASNIPTTLAPAPVWYGTVQLGASMLRKTVAPTPTLAERFAP